MDEINEERDPLTHRVIGAAMEVHREMGPGLLESVYQKCLERELNRQSIAYQPQAPLPLVYKGETIDEDFIMDVYIPGQLVVELKAVEKVLPIHEAQLLTYLGSSVVRCKPQGFWGFPCRQELSMVDSWNGRSAERTAGGIRCQGRLWPTSPSTSICPKAWRLPRTNAVATVTALRSRGPGPSGAGAKAATTRIRPAWNRAASNAWCGILTCGANRVSGPTKGSSTAVRTAIIVRT